MNEDADRQRYKKIAKDFVKRYSKASDDVAAMEKIRGSLLRMAGIPPKLYIPGVTDVDEDILMQMDESDRYLIRNYLENRNIVDTIRVAINERLSGRDADVAEDIFVKRCSSNDVINKYGFCEATYWRIRRKCMEAVTDEVHLREGVKAVKPDHRK